MLSVNVTGIAELQAALRRGVNPAPLQKLTGLLGVQAVQRNFDQSRDPVTGKTWKPLKNPRKGKKQLSGSEKPLMKSRVMRNGVTYDKPTATSVRIGAGIMTQAYNAIHNFGGLPSMAPGPAAIPKRHYMGLTPEDWENLKMNLRVLAIKLLKGLEG